VVGLVAAGRCGRPGRAPAVSGLAAQPEQPAVLSLSSPAFDDSADIPVEYTGLGRNVSPELRWTGASDSVGSYALICEDPDAPGGAFTHWVIYDIPAQSPGLAGGAPRVESLPNGTLQGRNDFGSIGYRGPEPPPGSRHRYFFRLYALDTALKVGPGLTAAELRREMAGHELGSGQLMGRFQRPEPGGKDGR
jgi:Raf kinase inhibitor-like YbhB/YbcL family protein